MGRSAPSPGVASIAAMAAQVTPAVPTRRDIEDAAGRISGRVRTTPVATVEGSLLGVPGTVVLKLEQLQHSGSFKARGAFNALLLAAERGTLPAAGVVAASGGNAGLAVAYVARELGVPARIFVPEATGPVKLARLRALGATVTVTPGFYADALAASAEAVRSTGALTVHAYDQAEVVAGQGTLGLELLEQAPVDTVLAAVGGGGLVSGVALATAGRARVVAVEPERIPTLHAALAAGQPVDVDVSGLAADALGARRVGDIALEVARGTAMHSVLVPDAALATARRRLWDELRVVVEPAGATAAAALLSGAFVPEPGEQVAVILCGANSDPSDLTGAP